MKLHALAALSAAALAFAAPAHAADAYVATGFPYLLIGVAQPVSDSVVLRADWGTAGHHSYSATSSDNDYRGTLNYSRFAAFADWFVAGGFRLTGGAVFANGKTDIKASSHNNQITIGGTTYNYTGDVASTVTLPSAAPYIGLGWGSPGNAAAGFSFHADLGVAFGKPKATDLKAEGDVAQFVSAADLATENRQYQDEVAKVKGIPQFTIGASYRF